jgi:TonB family protein
MAMLDQATPIAFLSGSQRLTLQSSNLRYALDELKKCNDALVASWGFDAAEQAHLIRRTDPRDGLTLAKRLNAQYPASQLRFARDAHVNVVLFVNADGKATRCIVPQSYNPPVFDTIACKTVMAASFEPALNQEGKPVASFLSSTIYFFAP